MSISVFVPSKLLIWASQQAVTRSDHLTIQTGHCPHCFKMVQQMSLSSWNGTTTLAHHGRRCQAWSKSSLQGEGNQIAALPQTHTQSPLQTLLKPLFPLFPSTNSKANKRPMLLTLEWTASLVSVQKSGHAFNWKFACDV